MANLQREHARSQQKNLALLDARAKNVGDLRSQLESQIESLKKQLADTQVGLCHWIYVKTRVEGAFLVGPCYRVMEIKSHPTLGGKVNTLLHEE